MTPQVVAALVVLAAKYGPDLIVQIIALFKKEVITVDELEALFGTVKPYEAFEIPDVAPVVKPSSTGTP